MYKINIVCVGKLKEKYLFDAQNEYSKRLKKFCKLDLIELDDTPLPQNPSKNEVNLALDREYEKILSNLKGQVFVCDPSGKALDSVAFSKEMIKAYDTADTITFVIGSSYGLSQKIKTNKMISFSMMTFPHHLMRIFLLEQIYRGFCIANNITYHK